MTRARGLALAAAVALLVDRPDEGAFNASDLLVDRSDLLAGLEPALDDVWAWCERSGGRGRTLTLKVKYGDFQQITRSRSSTSVFDNQAVLARVCRELLEGIFPLPKGVRLLGLSLSNLNTAERAAGRQLTLGF